MTPVDRGRFCSKCQKCIVDFTTYNAVELAQYFERKPENLCGRFLNIQLDRNLYEDFRPVKRRVTPLAAFLIILGSVVSRVKATALIPAKVSQHLVMGLKESGKANHSETVPRVKDSFVHCRFQFDYDSTGSELGYLNPQTGEKTFVLADSNLVFHLDIDTGTYSEGMVKLYRRVNGKDLDSVILSAMELKIASNNTLIIGTKMMPEILIHSPNKRSIVVTMGVNVICGYPSDFGKSRSNLINHPPVNPVTETPQNLNPNAKIPLNIPAKVLNGTHDTPGVPTDPRGHR